MQFMLYFTMLWKASGCVARIQDLLHVEFIHAPKRPRNPCTFFEVKTWQQGSPILSLKINSNCPQLIELVPSAD